SGLWLVMGALAAAIAVARPALHRSWGLLAGVALFASVDEYLEVHERLDVPGDVLAQHLPVEIGFTWVLVRAPIALVVGALLLRLVLSLPRRAALVVLLGGPLSLAGAVGIETISGRLLVVKDMVADHAYSYAPLVYELL